MFLKEEFYPALKAPRGILARADFAKGMLGPIFDSLNGEFFHLPEAVKKMPANRRPQYIDERAAGPHYYVTDHTAFECSATLDIQNHMEMLVYEKLLGVDNMKWVKNLTETQIVTAGNGCASVPCSRFSGEMNTSLGNSITNYIFIKMVMREFNVSGNFFIEGDDGLICLQEELDIAAVQKYAVANGFNLKMDKVESPREAGFLSTKWDDNGPFEYPLGPYLSNSMWTTITGMPHDELLLARLSSMIEQNPNNWLIYKLYKGFCKLYGKNEHVVYVVNNAYERERLDDLQIAYVEIVKNYSMLRYTVDKYDINVEASANQMKELYGINLDEFQRLADLAERDPESAVKQYIAHMGEGFHNYL